MADQILTIQPVSVTPTASQVAMSSPDIIPYMKEIAQQFQSKSYKDQYAGSASIDYTYSSLIKNTIKPKASDLLFSSADVVQTKDHVFITREASLPNARSITPKPGDVLLNAGDVMASAKDITKEGDYRHKIVKEIASEVDKSIKEWNKYNLAKTNRLLKTVESYVA
jgi:hypothetical protein